MKRALAFVVLLACTKPATTTDAAPVSPPSAMPSATASAASPVRRATPREVVETWNRAHTTHDPTLLASLYAPHVEFYGQTLTNAQCVAAKKRAFAKSPDYAQSIRDVVLGENGVVTFTKTSTSGGKSTDYPAVLVIAGDLITTETDKVTEENLAAARRKADAWCWAPDSILYPPNDAVIPPYKISAMEAYRRARESKYFKAKEAAARGKFIDFGQIVCPTTCDRAAFKCGYDMKLEDHSREALEDPAPHSIMLDWVYVDAVDGTLWYEAAPGDTWAKSELLPPLRK